ncbi:Tetratricopeptide repeat-containing protein [Spironucleus salmonicida]|uniref:Basal body protein n=1 Tax=Spironucleus salmonicida TaxID=348837 RepID=V6LQF6_9EUKA|nr:Tetratricopeptide repeat-containing protein [Spironucleus salmonicida]|eukprot:EST46902.1 Basal body protein [Spironucleus salmonicida]
MDPIQLAYMALRRYDYAAAIDIAEQLLKINHADQFALLIKTQAQTELSYFDETEFEENSLADFQEALGQNLNIPGTLPTSFRPSSRLNSGFVRPLTAAMGRPASKSASRLGSSRIATGALQSGRRTGHMTRMGTATVNNFQYSDKIPESYGGKPVFGRVFVNYLLRLQPLNDSDVTPNPAKALAFLQHYGEARGSDWFYCDRAARAYYLLGNYEEAERHLRAALRFLNREDSILKLSQALACRKQFANAKVILKEAELQFQTSPHVPLAAARLAEITQDGTQALNYYSQALQIDPGSLEALSGAAALISSGWQRQNSFLCEKDAIQLYKRLLLIRSNDASIWNNLGVCQLKDDLLGNAFISFLTALQKTGSFPSKIGFQSSVPTSTLPLQSDRIRRLRSEIFLNIGICFLKTSDFLAAQEAFECSLISDQTNSDSLTNLGVLAYKNGSQSRAIQLFTQAISVDQNEQAKKNRSVLMLEEGNVECVLEDAIEGSIEWKRVQEMVQ